MLAFQQFNSLPNDKILALIKQKAFADDIFSIAKMMISVFDKIETIVGEGENSVTSIFSFSHNVFLKGFI